MSSFSVSVFIVKFACNFYISAFDISWFTCIVNSFVNCAFSSSSAISTFNNVNFLYLSDPQYSSLQCCFPTIFCMYSIYFRTWTLFNILYYVANIGYSLRDFLSECKFSTVKFSFCLSFIHFLKNRGSMQLAFSDLEKLSLLSLLSLSKIFFP